MNENIKKIKSVINDLTEKMTVDAFEGNYDSYRLKIRVIDRLIHVIALIENMDGSGCNEKPSAIRHENDGRLSVDMNLLRKYITFH